MTMTKQCLKPSRNGMKTVFEEKKHHHWKNRRDAHFATVRPATLANGKPGASIRIGQVFAVLSAEEFEAIASRAAEAFATAETETQK